MAPLLGHSLHHQLHFKASSYAHVTLCLWMSTWKFAAHFLNPASYPTFHTHFTLFRITKHLKTIHCLASLYSSLQKDWSSLLDSKKYPEQPVHLLWSQQVTEGEWWFVQWILLSAVTVDVISSALSASIKRNTWTWHQRSLWPLAV